MTSSTSFISLRNHSHLQTVSRSPPAHLGDLGIFGAGMESRLTAVAGAAGVLYVRSGIHRFHYLPTAFPVDLLFLKINIRGVILLLA